MEERLSRGRDSIGDTRLADGRVPRTIGGNWLAMSADRRSPRSSITSSKSRRSIDDASSQLKATLVCGILAV
jgi:hypothetical protein